MLLNRDGTQSTVSDKRTSLQTFFQNIQGFTYSSLKVRLFRNIGNMIEELWVCDKHKKYKTVSERKKAIEDYCEAQGIDITSAIRPYWQYETINDFFIRKLRPELTPYLNVRKNKDKLLMSSMADCRLICFQNVKDAKRVWIKGNKFSMINFLGKDLNEKYKNGSIIINRLAPVDYHRYHCPVDLKVKRIIDIKSFYELGSLPVTKFAVNSLNANPFTVNTRVVIECENLHTKDDFLIILIGATGINSIVHKFNAGRRYKKFQDVGCFEIGGSTTVVVTQKDKILLDKDIVAHSLKGKETYIRVGEPIARIM